MRFELRLASTTEEALGLCVEKKIWAGRKKLSRNWKSGQFLLVRVDSRIAALGFVQGELAESQSQLFSDKFPLTVPVEWLWVAERPLDRPQFSEWIKSELCEAWGEHYGFKLLNQSIIPHQQAKRILSKFEQQAGFSLNELLNSRLSLRKD
ncbi:MAG TPA: hypothetical protein PKW95_23345 [bacterium]|nr:hypothetical protein [bacterium]